MFRTSRKQMIWLCRTMATMLDAGLPMSRVLTVAASQAPGGPLRNALQNVQARLEGGDTLAGAFEASGSFPALFLQLVAVGETSGTLDRTLAEATRFYEFQQRVWRHFVGQITLPVLQYVIAVAVVALVTFIVGMLRGQGRGVVSVLAVGYGVPLVLIACYLFAVNVLGASRIAHELILQIPVLGTVMRNLALARFSLIMYLMYEAAVPVPEALRRSFEGTGNAAFAARSAEAVETIERKGTLTDALLAAGVFTREYIEVMAVAEESGKISGRLDWLARNYEERAESSLSALVNVVAKLIYAAVGAIIIVFIFRIFMGYLGALQGAMGGR